MNNKNAIVVANVRKEKGDANYLDIAYVLVLSTQALRELHEHFFVKVTY